MVKTRMERFAAMLIWSAFLAMSIAPYRYGPLKAAALFASVIVLYKMPVRNHTSTRHISGILGLVSLGLVGTIVGALFDNFNVYRVAVVHTVWPLLFGILFHLVQTRMSRPVVFLTRLVVGLSCATSLAILGVVVLVRTGHQNLTGIVVDRSVSVTTYSGFFQTNYQAVNSLVFLAPFSIVLLAVRVEGVTRVKAIFSGLSAIGAITLSGRQALTAVALVVPFAVVTGARVLGQLKGEDRLKWGKRSKLLSLACALTAYVFLSKSGLNVVSSFGRIGSSIFTDDGGNVRGDQLSKLVSQGLTSPVFGRGIGASVPGYVRDPLSPGSYELSYAVLFLNFGLLGLFVLAWWALSNFLILARRNDHVYPGSRLSFLAGGIGFAIATVSNPYPFKIDGIWPLILVCCIGAFLRRPSESVRTLSVGIKKF